LNGAATAGGAAGEAALAGNGTRVAVMATAMASISDSTVFFIFNPPKVQTFGLYNYKTIDCSSLPEFQLEVESRLYYASSFGGLGNS
jgi:hypothetical protein